MRYIVAIIGAVGLLASLGIEVESRWVSASRRHRTKTEEQVTLAGIAASLLLLAIGLYIIHDGDSTTTDRPTASASSSSVPTSTSPGGTADTSSSSQPSPTTSTPGPPTGPGPDGSSSATHSTVPPPPSSTGQGGDPCWNHMVPTGLGEKVVLQPNGNINVDSYRYLTKSPTEPKPNCGGTVSFNQPEGKVDFSQSANLVARPTSAATCRAADQIWSSWQLSGLDNGHFLCGPGGHPGEYFVVQVVDASHLADAAATATVTLIPIGFVS